METIARNGKLIRVVLTGSESTGKSVLARELAAHYGAEMAPEFVREFALAIGREIRVEDTDEIARGQIALEDKHITSARGLLIQDTDLLSTVIYSDHYYNYCGPWIRQAALDRRPDLYLLLDIDVPWIPDGVRDREKNREEIQRLFHDAVTASGAPYVAISGSWELRAQTARSAIDTAIAGG